jgi:hypothetical protein
MPSYRDFIANRFKHHPDVSDVPDVLKKYTVTKGSAELYAARDRSLINYLPLSVLLLKMRKSLMKGNFPNIVHPIVRAMVVPVAFAGVAYDILNTWNTCHLGGMDDYTTGLMVGSRATQQFVSNIGIPLGTYTIAMKFTKNPFLAAGIAATTGLLTRAITEKPIEEQLIRFRLYLPHYRHANSGAGHRIMGRVLVAPSFPASDEHLPLFPNFMLAEVAPSSEVPGDVGKMPMINRYEARSMTKPVMDKKGDLHDFIDDSVHSITGIPVIPTDRLFKPAHLDALDEYSIAPPPVRLLDEMMGLGLPKDRSPESQKDMINNVDVLMKKMGL